MSFVSLQYVTFANKSWFACNWEALSARQDKKSDHWIIFFQNQSKNDLYEVQKEFVSVVTGDEHRQQLAWYKDNRLS